MNFYLLDTNIYISLLNQRGGFENIVQRMDGMSRENIGISAISVAELEFGIARLVKNKTITPNGWNAFYSISK